MSDSFHSADIQPGDDKSSHYLLINGLPAARFDELRKALDARQFTIEQAIEQQPCRRIEPGAAERV
jgi:hypothetical protein